MIQNNFLVTEISHTVNLAEKLLQDCPVTPKIETQLLFSTLHSALGNWMMVIVCLEKLHLLQLVALNKWNKQLLINKFGFLL